MILLYKIRLFRISLILLIIGSVLYACVPHKNLVILTQDKKIKSDSLIKAEFRKTYLIQPGDLISIKVSSIDPSSVAIFNKEIGGGRSNQFNEPAIYLTSYLVSDSGYVNMPMIGKLTLINMSIMDATFLIERELAAYYKFVSVDVKLMSFRVSILGEIKTPGIYNFYNERVNIIQALSHAGGFTDLSNRSKVKIIRNEDGKLKINTLNLKNDEIFNTQFYYLQPNDAIYVEPLKAKVVKVNAPTLQVIISTLTFALVASNFFLK